MCFWRFSSEMRRWKKMTKMKEKSGNATVFLSEKERKEILAEGVTLRHVLKIGMMAIKGTLPKIQKLAEKLSFYARKAENLEAELSQLRAEGKKCTNSLK